VLTVIVGIVCLSANFSYAFKLIAFYGFFFLLLIEWALEPKLNTTTRAILIFVTLIGIAVFTYIVPLSQAPCKFEAYLHKDDGNLSKIEGVDWNKHFSDVRIAVANPTDEPYKDLDISINVDSWINKAVILNPIQGCDLTRNDGNAKLSVAKNDHKGQITFEGRRSGTGADVYDSAGNQYIDLATHAGYRLRCSILPSNYTVRLLYVAVSPKQLPPQAPPGGMALAAGLIPMSQDMDLYDAALGSRPRPNKATFKGSYSRGLKPFSIDTSIPID